jgi:hypothetical protein
MLPEASSVFKVQILNKAKTFFWLFTLHRILDRILIILIKIQTGESSTCKAGYLMEQPTSPEPSIRPNEQCERLI